MSTASGTLREATAGLWRRNMVLAQLLGLCPLLAVTTSAVNGIALGIMTTLVLVCTNTAVSLVRSALIPLVRIPIIVLLIAALVTCVDLLTHAVFDELHEALGLFIPLIVTNCGILAQAESVASRRPVGFAAWSGLATGFGFLAVLTALGALREIFGHGTLFAGIATLGGPSSEWLAIDLPGNGMLVAILPPGAFFGIAALLALRNRFASSTTADSDA